MVASRESLQVIRLAGCDIFLGSGIPTSWQNLYGGQTLGQSVISASRTVEDEFPIHSVHSYFILTGNSTKNILFQVERTRDGGSFRTRSCKIICNSEMSFHRVEKGFTFKTKLRNVVPNKFHERLNIEYIEKLENTTDFKNVQRKIIAKVNGFTLMAIKSSVGLKDSWKENCAMLTFVSDLAPVRSVAMEFPDDADWAGGFSSLDHTVRFHQPLKVRADEWMYFCCQPVIVEGNRGFCQCYIYNLKEEHLATVSQEALMRKKDLNFVRQNKTQAKQNSGSKL
eukprot:maker-scaffold_18-snap-gene-5.2-mRNA-1 protein AED:0.10 eAED:0.38 QI:0/0/0.5/1/1/1/2/20/281